MTYRLSKYYSKSLKSRPQAFKYKLKSADQSISKGAYSLGLLFLREAYQWVSNISSDDDEYTIMLEVCVVAIEDLRDKLFIIKSASLHDHNDHNDDRDDNNDNNHNNNRDDGRDVDPRGYDEAYLHRLYDGYSSLHSDLLKQSDHLKHSKRNRRVDTDKALNWQPSYASNRKPFKTNILSEKRLKDHDNGKGYCCIIA